MIAGVEETTRQRLIAAVFAIVALMHLLPVWRVDYLPTVDGASHVYNAVVLHELSAGTPAFQRVFTTNLRPSPNWLGHALMWLVLPVVSPIVAEKLLVSAIVLLFLAGCWRLAGVIDRGSRMYALLVMPLTFHVLLQMGFYNHSLGAALALFAIASAWEGRDQTSWRPVIATAAWLLVCYFAHALPAAIAIFFIAVIWIISMLSRGWKVAWHLGLSLIPTAILLLWFALQPKPPGGHWTWAGAILWQPLMRVAVLLTFSLRQLTFGTAMGAAFGVLIVVTLARENIDWKRRRITVRERDTFLLLAALAIVLYLAAPISVEEGLLLKARFLLFPYLLILPWLTPRVPRLFLATIFAIVAVCNVFYIRDCWKRNSKDLELAMAPLSAAAPLHTIVPLVFDGSAPNALLALFSHAASNGFAEHRLIDLGDYEAALPYFPVAFRPGVKRPEIIDIQSRPAEFDPEAYAPDYVYTWKMPAGAPVAQRLASHYKIVGDAGDAKLYARK